MIFDHLIIENFLSQIECDFFKDMIDNNISGYINNVYKSNRYDSDISSFIWKRLKDKCDTLNMTGIKVEERITLVKYINGSLGIDRHLDLIKELGVKIVGILYLNNSDDGYTEFDNFTVKPEIGKLLLFNVNKYHKGNPTNNDKYIIVFRLSW